MRVARLFQVILGVLVVAFGQARGEMAVPMKFQSGLVWIQVSVRGTFEPLNFLLDSGAGSSVLDVGTARRLGVELGATEQVQGVGGAAIAHRVERIEGSFAGIPLPRRMLALDLGSVSAVCGRKVDGLLGVEFFHGRIVQIDFDRQLLRLLKRGELRSAGAEALPLSRRGDALCTRISVSGSPEKWVRVDTGCTSALRWVTAPSTESSRRAPSIGVAVESRRHTAADVQLGSICMRAVKTSVHRHAIFSGESGLLGNGLLSRFTVTFDVEGKRLFLGQK